ncbi:serine/threonine-protein kinase [Vibrio furnissii]|uniref:serine/threonine-protein kinase n=1 Tax=Vibrio furnissii TaxID=29494 RepID=UPI0024BB811F|nr:serine/threonine-protein kinase [Vibrio furnissii]WHR53331.1 serine/threonine-protein kinase [Vibrio furnissii]
MSCLIPTWLEGLLPDGERIRLGRRCLLVRDEQQAWRVKFGETVEDAYVLQREALWLMRLRHLDMPLHRTLSLHKTADKTVLMTTYLEGQSAALVWPGYDAPHVHQWFAHSLPTLLGRLALLHTSGVVHGDIKPSNILCLPTMAACFVDFANARRIGDPWKERGMVQFTPSFHYPSSSPVASVEHDFYALLICMALLAAPSQLAACSTVGAVLTLVALKSTDWGVSDEVAKTLAQWISAIRLDLGAKLDTAPQWSCGLTSFGDTEMSC